MSLLHVHVVPDAVLRRKSKRVTLIDKSIRRLAQDMIETMDDALGVGLAAPQVGVTLRVITLRIPSSDEEQENEPVVLVNPTIVKRSGVRELEEGCLSIPGYRGWLDRSVHVLVKGQDLAGREIRIKQTDTLLAQALEHEIDHLNGILFIDHIHDPDKLVRIEGPASVEIGTLPRPRAAPHLPVSS